MGEGRCRSDEFLTADVERGTSLGMGSHDCLRMKTKGAAGWWSGSIHNTMKL